MSDYQAVVIEDDEDVRLGCLQALALDGIKAQGFDSVEAISPALTKDYPGVVITDIRLPGVDGMAFLKQLADDDPDLPVILITGHGDIETAVAAG